MVNYIQIEENWLKDSWILSYKQSPLSLKNTLRLLFCVKKIFQINCIWGFSVVFPGISTKWVGEGHITKNRSAGTWGEEPQSQMSLAENWGQSEEHVHIAVLRAGPSLNALSCSLIKTLECFRGQGWWRWNAICKWTLIVMSVDNRQSCWEQVNCKNSNSWSSWKKKF